MTLEQFVDWARGAGWEVQVSGLVVTGIRPGQSIEWERVDAIWRVRKHRRTRTPPAPR